MSVSLNDYPLHDVLGVKKRRVEEARKNLQLKEQELEKERQKLLEREKERDKVKAHLQAKFDQLRQAFDEGTNSDEILMMKGYIEVVKTDLEKEEEKVKKQLEQVELAKKAVEVAKTEVKAREAEVDKLKMHREEWVKEMKKEIELKEAIELDEIGNILFLAKRNRS